MQAAGGRRECLTSSPSLVDRHPTPWPSTATLGRDLWLSRDLDANLLNCATRRKTRRGITEEARRPAKQPINHNQVPISTGIQTKKRTTRKCRKVSPRPLQEIPSPTRSPKSPQPKSTLRKWRPKSVASSDPIVNRRDTSRRSPPRGSSSPRRRSSPGHSPGPSVYEHPTVSVHQVVDSQFQKPLVVKPRRKTSSVPPLMLPPPPPVTPLRRPISGDRACSSTSNHFTVHPSMIHHTFEDLTVSHRGGFSQIPQQPREPKSKGIVELQEAFDAMLREYQQRYLIKPLSIQPIRLDEFRPLEEATPSKPPSTPPPPPPPPVSKQRISSGCLVALGPPVPPSNHAKPSVPLQPRLPREKRTPLSPRTILEARTATQSQAAFSTKVVLDARTLPKPKQREASCSAPSEQLPQVAASSETAPAPHVASTTQPPENLPSPQPRPDTLPVILSEIPIIRALTFRSVVLNHGPFFNHDPLEEIVYQDLTSSLTIMRVQEALTHVPIEESYAISDLRELPTRPMSKLALQTPAMFELRRELSRETLRDDRHFSESFSSKRQGEMPGEARPDTVPPGETQTTVPPLSTPLSSRETPPWLTNVNRAEAGDFFTEDNNSSASATPILAPSGHQSTDLNGRALRSPSYILSEKAKSSISRHKLPNSNSITTLSRTGKIFLACCVAPSIFTFGALLFQISCECV